MSQKLLLNVAEQIVSIEQGCFRLKGELVVPENAEGIVLFAHVDTSSRYSTRSHFLARLLHQARIATLLIDMLTTEEETLEQRSHHFCGDIKHQASRLILFVNWLLENSITRHLKIGIFGDKIGGAAALLAAAEHPIIIRAIVSCTGKIDLASSTLCNVQSPTLLIVGENDLPFIAMNEDALSQIPAQDKLLKIIPGATHLFESPEALEEVGRLASIWFNKFLSSNQKHDINLHALQRSRQSFTEQLKPSKARDEQHNC